VVFFTVPRRMPPRWYWDTVPGYIFVERWEENRFNPEKYVGKMGAFWKSEIGLPQYLWTGPKFEVGVNPLTYPPWNNAVHMVNSKDGKTVDEIFFAVPFAFRRAKMRVDARIPNPSKVPEGTHLYIGFEVVGAGGHAFAGLHLFRAKGGVGTVEFGWVLIGEDGFKERWVHPTIYNPDRWATYFLELDFPWLRLYQQLTPQVAPEPFVAPVLTDQVKAPEGALNKEFWFQPFFANESQVIVEGFYIGEFEVWRTDPYEMSVRPADPVERLFPRGVLTLELDDGRLDAYQNAFPELKSRGLKATIAVITNLLDTGANWEGYPTITWSQLDDYKYEGFEIVSHSQSHPHLTTVDDDTLDSELYGSLNSLRAHGHNVQGFACPYAEWSEKIIENVKNYYRYMTSVISGHNLLASIDPFRLAIYNIGESTSQSTFEEILDRTRRYRLWTILLFHGVPITVDPGHEDYDISLAKFKQFLDLIQMKNIPVMTHSEVLTIIEATLGLPKNKPPLWMDYVTGTTTDSFVTVLSWHCQRYRDKTIVITNTHASNDLYVRIFKVPARGGYGITDMPESLVLHGYGQHKYVTSEACFSLQVQVRSAVSGQAASYQIDYCGRTEET